MPPCLRSFIGNSPFHAAFIAFPMVEIALCENLWNGWLGFRDKLLALTRSRPFPVPSNYSPFPCFPSSSRVTSRFLSFFTFVRSRLSRECTFAALAPNIPLSVKTRSCAKQFLFFLFSLIPFYLLGRPKSNYIFLCRSFYVYFKTVAHCKSFTVQSDIYRDCFRERKCTISR